MVEKRDEAADINFERGLFWLFWKMEILKDTKTIS